MAKKPRSGPAVLTANELLSGRVVFWTGERWTGRVAEAARAATDEARTALEASARGEEAANRVTGAYLMTLDAVTGEPVLLRERHRLAGPSVIPFLPTA